MLPHHAALHVEHDCHAMVGSDGTLPTGLGRIRDNRYRSRIGDEHQLLRRGSFARFIRCRHPDFVSNVILKRQAFFDQPDIQGVADNFCEQERMDFRRFHDQHRIVHVFEEIEHIEHLLPAGNRDIDRILQAVARRPVVDAGNRNRNLEGRRILVLVRSGHDECSIATGVLHGLDGHLRGIHLHMQDAVGIRDCHIEGITVGIGKPALHFHEGVRELASKIFLEVGKASLEGIRNSSDNLRGAVPVGDIQRHRSHIRRIAFGIDDEVGEGILSLVGAHFIAEGTRRIESDLAMRSIRRKEGLQRGCGIIGVQVVLEHALRGRNDSHGILEDGVGIVHRLGLVGHGFNRERDGESHGILVIDDEQLDGVLAVRIGNRGYGDDVVAAALLQEGLDAALRASREDVEFSANHVRVGEHDVGGGDEQVEFGKVFL